MLQACRALGIAFLIGCILSSCGSAKEDTSESSVSVVSSERQPETREGAYIARQEAITLCMRAEGFDYQQASFVAVMDMRLSSVLELSDAERFGYAGVVTGVLTSALIPAGRPPLTMSRDELVAYERALMGDLSPSGFDHAGELHLERSGGCRDLASAAYPYPDDGAVRVDSDDGIELVVRFFDQLAAAPPFAEFEDAWATCLATAGYEPTHGLLATHGTRSFELADEARDIIAKSYELDPDSGTYIIPGLSSNATIDGSVMETVIISNGELLDLLHRERAESSSDQKCREEHWGLVSATLDKISVEILGQPYGDT